jgi:transcriptional regulator with XRE-family HTH domain
MMLESELLQRRKVFGRWLRDCRRQAHITQADLAKALAYDSSQIISNIERGVSLLPSKRLPEFARALGCSLLEMEVRYFQCSARNTSESRMPDLLMKYLPIIEAMEFGRGSDEEILAAVRYAQGNASNQAPAQTSPQNTVPSYQAEPSKSAG